MGKLLVVEGLDRCGKSTLVKSLKTKILNPRIVTLSSSSPPIGVDDSWSIQHYSSLFENIATLVETGFMVIFDRFHIGETVYGPVYRGSNTGYIWELEEALISAIGESAYLLLLTDEGKNIAKRDDGLSLESSASEYDKIGSKFKISYDKSVIPNKLQLNITDDGWAKVEDIYRWVNV